MNIVFYFLFSQVLLVYLILSVLLLCVSTFGQDVEQREQGVRCRTQEGGWLGTEEGQVWDRPHSRCLKPPSFQDGSQPKSYRDCLTWKLEKWGPRHRAERTALGLQTASSPRHGVCSCLPCSRLPFIWPWLWTRHWEAGFTIIILFNHHPCSHRLVLLSFFTGGKTNAQRGWIIYPRSHSKSTVELGFEPESSLEMGTETQASVQSQYVAQSLACSRDTIYIWWINEYTHSGCYIFTKMHFLSL